MNHDKIKVAEDMVLAIGKLVQALEMQLNLIKDCAAQEDSKRNTNKNVRVHDLA